MCVFSVTCGHTVRVFQQRTWSLLTDDMFVQCGCLGHGCMLVLVIFYVMPYKLCMQTKKSWTESAKQGLASGLTYTQQGLEVVKNKVGSPAPGTAGTGGGSTGHSNTGTAGAQPGYNASSQAGYNAGSQPGYGAGAQPGYNTGAQPGYNTGAQPGHNTGAQPGYNTGTNQKY